MSRHVLFVLPSLTGLGGGIELYDRHVVEAVARAWPEARLTALLGREAELARPELLDEAVRARLRVIGVGASARRARQLELVARATVLAAERPTLVVCGHVNYVAAAAWVARLAGARLLTLLYGVEAWNVRGLAAQRGLAAVDVHVSISAFTAAQVLRTLPLDPARVVVVPNAVDGARFTPGPTTLEARLADAPRPRLLTVARLDAAEAYKGVDTVVRALATMTPRPSYVVVGDGSDLPRLQALAAELGVAVRFWGRASDAELPALYRAADLFVMPSRNEGFGYVFIEALACGVPVIAGGVDGSVDALDGGRLGRLVDPFDVAALARAIDAELAAAGATTPAARHAAVTARFGREAFDARWRAVLARL